MVCGPAPRSTVTLPGVSMPLISDDMMYGFVSPTRNLACGLWDSGTVACEAIQLSVAMPPDPQASEAAQYSGCRQGFSVSDDGAGILCNGGVIVADQLPKTASAPVLNYGDIIVTTDYPNPYADIDTSSNDPVACQSAMTGITCWDTVTAHGFSLAKDVAVFW